MPWTPDDPIARRDCYSLVLFVIPPGGRLTDAGTVYVSADLAPELRLEDGIEPFAGKLGKWMDRRYPKGHRG